MLLRHHGVKVSHSVDYFCSFPNSNQKIRGLTSVFYYQVGAAAIFTILTGFRILGAKKRWHPFIPGGIAVAVGMYNVPSFTLARAIGGFIQLYYRKRSETTIVILASGLILGEGVVSIVNLILASAKVPHL